MRVTLTLSEPEWVTESLREEAERQWKALLAKPAAHVESLGWLSCQGAAAGALDAIREKAAEVRARDDVFLVVGVGGSNQAARAVINAIGERGMRVAYLGNTLSAREIAETLAKLDGKRVCMQVIAKNFETLEPGSHYRILRKWFSERYTPEEIKKRVILTGTQGSRLHQIAEEQGHLFLPFPKDVGGRYSAFSPVALMPIAAAGLDISEYIRGGQEMEEALCEGNGDAVFTFAAWRRECLRRGFDIELLCAFEPRMAQFGRWWRQLFGESEGKEGKGIFPACAMYSEDLHSIGQYVQEGPRRLMETFLCVRNPQASVVIPPDPAFGDGFDYLDGMDFAQVNRAAERATIAAHSAGGVPCAQILVERIDERAMGALFYFFMASCAVSARLLGVNPFDQNGVEAYKRSLFDLLKLPAREGSSPADRCRKPAAPRRR